ncbi:hypothetical protein AVEN_70800-1 [Araneus ventricosus]|uniref:Uncharacterized protein n=1 Tax=Araneus ventricosus TaxID=182803 RepID=A0A4Y2V0M7_ARAVE|nr:hypothetical protein AVEN_248086-1 [Araneus ventricosus]GBO18745.1 hypothetical protein AVEN_70800-1 [Araneus ventricosus]
MAVEGIETRATTGDVDIYIVRFGLEKAISHPIVDITGQYVDLVVLLIALAPPESNIYFMKTGKRKVEAKLFSTRKLQKELSFPQTILLLHAFRERHNRREKTKHYSYSFSNVFPFVAPAIIPVLMVPL